MPQIRIECSTNIVEQNLKPFFQTCHTLLAQTLPTDLNNCKSRAVACEQYCIGDDQPQRAFVHMQVQVLSGRSAELLTKLGDELLILLQHYFKASMAQLDLQLSVEIQELSPHYFKN